MMFLVFFCFLRRLVSVCVCDFLFFLGVPKEVFCGDFFCGHSIRIEWTDGFVVFRIRD